MKDGKRIKMVSVLAAALVILAITAVMPAFAQQSASAIRDIEIQTLAPGESTDITVTITNNVTQALSLDEDIPAGWNLTRVSDDANQFKPSTNEWIWFSAGAGVTKTVIYNLEVPSDATAGDYSITGTIINASGVIDAVKGEGTITVEVPPVPKSASATRDIEKQTLAPGKSTNIAVTISNNVTQALSLAEDIPAGWSLTRVSDDADQFKPSTNEWVWFSVGAGVTKTVIYSLTVPGGATAGDYSITGTISNASGVIDTVKGEDTVTIETTPPEIIPVFPINGTTGVSITTTISATFSEAMNEASAQDAFSINGVAGTFSWAEDTMTFTPSASLAYSTTYTATIGTGAQDLAGNPMASAYTWSFTTELEPTPPPRRRGGGGAPRDSDGDGYTDIQEMLAGTDKEDPCDPNPECAACLAIKPAATPAPTPTPTVTVTPTPTIPPTVAPPTPTPTPEEPGFGAVFAIAGLLAVAYLVLRRKRK